MKIWYDYLKEIVYSILIGCSPITPLASPFTTKNSDGCKSEKIQLMIWALYCKPKIRKMYILICFLLFWQQWILAPYQTKWQKPSWQNLAISKYSFVANLMKQILIVVNFNTFSGNSLQSYRQNPYKNLSFAGSQITYLSCLLDFLCFPIWRAWR